MVRLSKENAIKMIKEIEKARLEKLSKQELVELCLNGFTINGIEDLTLAQIGNRLSALSHGQYSVIRTDLGES